MNLQVVGRRERDRHLAACAPFAARSGLLAQAAG